MPIRLAGTVADDVRAILEEVRQQAQANEAGYWEGEWVQIDCSRVRGVARRLNKRGKEVLYVDVHLNGKRSGFNAVVGHLEGR